MKPFKLISEQIDLMKQRGIIFNDEAKASNFLLRKNYYNTVNVYGKYFLEGNGQDIYKQDTNFDDICAMYDFEKRLRDHMFNMSMTVEANVTSTIAYYFTKKFPNPGSYLELGNYCATCSNTNWRHWVKLQKVFTNLLIDAKRYNPNSPNSASHYLQRYDSVPLWVIINNMTFGNVINMYRVLDNHLKQEIAKSFGDLLTISYGRPVNLRPNEMQQILDMLTNLRNKVAHDSCLSLYRTNNGRNTILNNLNRAEYVHSNSSRNKFYDVMLVARFFVSKNAHLNFVQNILTEITILETKVNDKSVLPALMNDLGFNFYS